MDVLNNLKDTLEKEISKTISKGEIMPADLKGLGEAVDILKDIETICAMQEYGGEDDYSYAMSNRGYSTRRYMYEDGHSNKRDSRGRYSRNSEKDEMIEKLERMMQNASSDRERMDISECISKLERM